MKAVFSGLQLGHDPQRYLARGHIVDFPEQPERARRLLQGARAADCEVTAAKTFDIDHILAVHPERYFNFLETAHPAWLAADNAYPEVMPSVRPVEGPSGYPEDILGRAGYHMMDFSCSITAQTFSAVKASAFSALTAVDWVKRGEPVAYALCRPPGHHAYAERAGGFCFLNNSAIAAQYLRTIHDRVAILDVDVHHGNGTQGIFYDRADVLTISLHADPSHYYPFFYGYGDQTGSGEGEGYNLNLAMPVKSKDPVWLASLETALARIESFQASALVVALGLDAHEADPLAGGAMTARGFYEMAGQIAKLKLPSVLVQEGGYLTEHLSTNLTQFLTGFEAAA